MEGVATVVKNAGSHYELSALPAWDLFPAVLRGKVRLERSGATNPVAVGDRVRYETDGPADIEHPAVITEILPRDNYIIRRSTNLSRQSHVIAANLDQAVIVVSLLFPEIKLPFLDRILVTCEVYKVPVLIALNKVDFPTPCVPMKCTLPSNLISAYGTCALLIKTILFRYLIFHLLIDINAHDNLLYVMESRRHLVQSLHLIDLFRKSHIH